MAITTYCGHCGFPLEDHTMASSCEPWREAQAGTNPYRAVLEELLNKIHGGGNEGVGQRRGIRRAIAEVDRVWAEQNRVGP